MYLERCAKTAWFKPGAFSNEIHLFKTNWSFEAGFPHALEIMESLENQKKKIHAWKNHGI